MMEACHRVGVGFEVSKAMLSPISLSLSVSVGVCLSVCLFLSLPLSTSLLLEDKIQALSYCSAAASLLPCSSLWWSWARPLNCKP